MLFVYIVAAILAGVVGVGSVVLFSMGLDSVAANGIEKADSVLAFFLLTAIIAGSFVSVVFLLKAAYEELVYWDFPSDIRRFIWNLTQKLSSADYIVSVHWWGYRTERCLGMGMDKVNEYYWFGLKKSEYVIG